MTIRFTATTDSYGTYHFRNEDDFIRHLDTLWSTDSWGRRYQSEQLWNKEPESYPCIMITSGTMSNSYGPDWIINHFLYDATIHDGEAENSWQHDLEEA